MALTKYRLVNTQGLSLLDTSAGRFRLDQIDDAVAEQLHANGSRYVEPVPDPAVALDEVAPPTAPKALKAPKPAK